jgi:hypothetical protein
MTPSKHYEVPTRRINMTGPMQDNAGTQSIMSVSGIRCSLYREPGYLDYTRDPHSYITYGTTFMTPYEFLNNTEKAIIPSMLTHFQWSSFNFHAPRCVIPGLGAAPGTHSTLCYDNDAFTSFALNFLYASGEAYRIVYEAALNRYVSPAPPPSYYTDVAGMASRQ